MFISNMTNAYTREYRTDNSDQLMNIFFSDENINVIQLEIIKEVKMNTRVQISRQSTTELVNFMHKAYKLEAEGHCGANNLQSDIIRLNKVVVSDCVPNIIEGLRSYIEYRKFIEVIPAPLERGISTNIDKTLELTPMV